MITSYVCKVTQITQISQIIYQTKTYLKLMNKHLYHIVELKICVIREICVTS